MAALEKGSSSSLPRYGTLPSAPLHIRKFQVWAEGSHRVYDFGWFVWNILFKK